MIFDALDDFVDQHVVVNGEQRGLLAFRSGLEAMVGSFPDYHWRMDHLLVDPPWVAAHFTDSGTHLGPALGVAPTGRPIDTGESAFYRFAADRIVEAWVTADNLGTLRQLRDEPSS